MKKIGDSCKMMALYIATYAFIIGAFVLGANLSKVEAYENGSLVSKTTISGDTNTKENLVVSEDTLDIGDFLSGDYNENELLVRITTKDFAQRILDGSLVKNLIVKSNFLSDDNRIGVLQFSGDLFDLTSGDSISGEKTESGEKTATSGETLSFSFEEGSEFIVVDQAPAEEVPAEVVVEEPTVLIDGVPTHYTRYIDCQATAYCLCQKCTGKTPSSPGYGSTASGYRITPGKGEKIVAVDRRQIPLGTHVYVEGLNGAWDYGYALAADTGGAIKNNRIDLYMDSHQDCLKWGRKQVRVYILD